MTSFRILSAALLVAITAFIFIAAADVGMDISCYNGGDDMSLSLDAHNIDSCVFG